jgi:glycosyltransferase involved in cell wall biosynthesis
MRLSKVCFDITSLSTRSRYRGFGTYALSLARAFSRAFGCAPEREGLDIYLAIGGGLAMRVVPLPDEPPSLEEVAGPGPATPYTLYYALKQTVALARLIEARVDLVHSAEPKGTAFPPGARVVVTCHDLIPTILGGPYRSPIWPGWASAAVDKLRYRRPDHVIAISEHTQQDVMRVTGVPRERVSVVHHGVDTAVFHPERREGEAEIVRRVAGERPYFLYVGGYDQRKRVPELIDAFARRAGEIDQALVIVGHMTARNEASLTSVIASSGMKERVLLAGFVPPEHLPALYRRADAHVMPSTYEGFGMTIVEAFACGCPVIAADASSIPEIAGGAALFVPPGDDDALGEAMVRVGSDEALRRSLSARGLERAARFTWERCAAETLRVYREVLGRTRGRSRQ